MKKLFVPLATAVLTISLSAQTSPSPARDNTRAETTRADSDRDYGWIGLIGLVGLAGLLPRRRTGEVRAIDRENIRRTA